MYPNKININKDPRGKNASNDVLENSIVPLMI